MLFRKVLRIVANSLFRMDVENSNMDVIKKFGSKEIRNNDTKKNVNSIGSASVCDTSSSTESDPSLPHAPDGGWGWMVVFASFIAHLIADGCGFSIGVLFAEWLNVFGESKGKTAFVSSLFVSMPAICGPVASIITNKFGCRSTTVAGGCIAAIGCFVSSFANSIEVLCITFGVIAGFGLALVYVPAVVVVAFYFEKRRAFATGLAVAGSGIGTFIFAPLTEFLIETYSWRGALVIISGIMLNIAVCGALFRPLVSIELQKKNHKYILSLERFSHASSIQQSRLSRDGIDKKLDSYFGESLNLDGFSRNCISHSLVLLPTYMNSYGRSFVSTSRDIKTQGRHNSKSLTDFSLKTVTQSDCLNDVERGQEFKSAFNTVEPKVKCQFTGHFNENKPLTAINDERLDTGDFNLSQTTGVGKRKRIRFPEHLVPRSHTDIFYRGSLLKAGFLLSRGQSASCPDIFIHERRRRSLREHCQSLQFSHLFSMIRNVSDFTIFKNKMFLFFCLHSMLLYVSYDIPYVYIPSKAMTFKISDEWASYLVSVIGIVSTLGQVFMGYIGDRSSINCLYFYIAMIVVAGSATLIVPTLTKFTLLAAYCGVFGFFISANFALTTIIVVELLGMDQLTNAYGFISLAEGLANLIGPPLAGWIIDTTGSFDLAFYLAGLVICISGLMLLIVPCTRKCQLLTRRDSCDEDPVGALNISNSL